MKNGRTKQKNFRNLEPFLSPFVCVLELLLFILLCFSLHRNSASQSSRPTIFQFYLIKSNLRIWRHILPPEKSYWAHKQIVHQREGPGINSCCLSRPFDIEKVKVESSKEMSNIARARQKEISEWSCRKRHYCGSLQEIFLKEM